MPGPGVDCLEMIRKIHSGEIKALLTLCFNPKVSLPNNQYVGAALDRLEFMSCIDFFMSETARHADVVLPGSLQEEDAGVVTQIEGRVIKINQAVTPPGDAQQDWRIIQDLAAALGRPHGFTFASPREIFEELRLASKGGVADYSGITYEKIDAQNGVFWPCPRKITLVHAGFLNPTPITPWLKGQDGFTFPMVKPGFVSASTDRRQK